MIKRCSIFFLFALAFCSSQLVAQQTISGGIIDAEGIPVRGANLMLQFTPDGQIVTFAITDSDGGFQLSVPIFTDSLWLKVSHLNHDDQSRWITPLDTSISFILQDRVYDLPTMTVKQEAVIRRGDTLVFDVNQLREVGDESIEALLRHIPGITIAANGKISYQDLEISKFYIEGLDMLEGRYAIATRNLNMNAVRDIEILEHHQPIRALDSLVRPPNAAINLRLKSDITFTGTARAGAGATPLLHMVETTLFGFSKQQQFSLLGAANNVGNATAENFRDLYGTNIIAFPLVKASTAQPPIEAARSAYLNNDELSGGFNFLRKTGKDAQLKWNGYASRDQIDAIGRSELTYQDEDGELTVTQILRSNTQPLTLNNNLTYEINNRRFFLKSSLKGKYSMVYTEADNEINGIDSPEDLERGEFDLRGRFESIIRNKKKAYRIKGHFDYVDEQIDLRLSPLRVITPDLEAFSLDSALQTVRSKRFTSDVHSTYFFRSGFFTGDTRFGLRTERRFIISALTDEEGGTIGSDFNNNNRTSLLIPYLTQNYKHERAKRTWSLSLPFATHFFGFNDGMGDEQTQRTLLVLRPELSYVRRMKHQRALSFSYQFGLDYNQDEDLFTSYILRQNRSFSRSLPNLNRTREHKLTARLRGQSLKKNISYNTHLTAGVKASDFLAQTVFDTSGEASNQVRSKNIRRNFSANNRFEFHLFPSLTTKLEANYALTIIPLILNSRRRDIAIHRFSVDPEFTYVFPNSALSFRPNFEYFNNALAGRPTFRSNIHCGYFQELPDKWGSFKVSVEYHEARVSERKVRNSLLNLRYKRPVLSGKYELSILLNNLTNAKDFISFTQGSYYEELSFFQLRRRQLFLVFGKKI